VYQDGASVEHDYDMFHVTNVYSPWGERESITFTNNEDVCLQWKGFIHETNSRDILFSALKLFLVLVDEDFFFANNRLIEITSHTRRHSRTLQRVEKVKLIWLSWIFNVQKASRNEINLKLKVS
jgi:hypothetical protein